MDSSAEPNGLREDVRVLDAWALYFSKFATAYAAAGAPLWGFTVQNEPEFAAEWEACAYNESFMMSFVGHHLGPRLAADHPGMKIMAYDHNKDDLPKWVAAMENSSAPAARYLDGFAFHWYAGSNERMLDGTYGYANLRRMRKRLSPRGMFLLGAEACECPGVAQGANAWIRAERYAHDILHDLISGVAGWTDWNLLLDSRGGPNHLANNCDAPVICDPDHAAVRLQPTYHVLGHFSRHLPPGSRAVASYADAAAPPRFGRGAENDTDASVMANFEGESLLLYCVTLTAAPTLK